MCPEVRRAAAGRRGWAVAVVLLAALFIGVSPLPTVVADTTTVMAATLPSAREGTSAVYDGTHVYVFGGDGGVRTDEIVRYDPDTDTRTVMGATLPTPRSGTSAVATGDAIFVFGGWNGSPYSRQIVRYDPVNDTTTVMAAELPTGRYYTSAVWTGDYAYIFGGGITCNPCTTDEIVRYDPGTDTIQVMAAKLPTRRYGTSAVWDGTYAYIFGGVTASTNTEHDDIVRYHPGTDTVALLSATLPTARYHTSAAFDGGRAYVFGGYPCPAWPNYCKEIVEFDPATGNVTTLSTELSTGRYLTSAAGTVGQVYIFGGYDGARRDQILRFGPADPPPPPPPPNHAPVVLPVGDVAVATDALINFTIQATDPDNDTLTLSVFPLPGSATFTDHGDGNGTFTWNTTTPDAGVYVLTARADDGDLNDTDVFVVSVSGNPPPTIDPLADITVAEGVRVLFLATADDPDDDPLTLGATSLPWNATFVDNGGGVGTFDWTPGFNQSGIYALTVTAFDGNTTASEPFSITVTDTDRPPELDPTTEVVLVEGVLGSALVHADDPDGDPVVLMAGGLPAGAVFTDLGAGNGRIDWTPPALSMGVYDVTVTATSNLLDDSVIQRLRVVPAVDFKLRPLGPSFVKASPLEALMLPVEVTNLGGVTDTIRFRVQDAAPTAQGWTLAAPAPITLGPGASGTVLVPVTVPGHGTFAKPRLIANSTLQPLFTKMLTWVVDVPVLLTIVPEDATPSVVDMTFLPIQGHVNATWWNGTPAVAVTVVLSQVPRGIVQLATGMEGPTNSTGVFAYNFGTDPLASLPGDHVLTASVTRAARTDSVSLTYTVGVA